MKRFLFATLLFPAFMFFSGGLQGQIIGGGFIGNDCIDISQICISCNCLMVYDPVCGCNDVTYSNSCFAAKAGVKTWTEGACGSSATSYVAPKSDQLVFYSGLEQSVVVEIMDAEGQVISTPLEGILEAGKEYFLAPELPAGDYVCQVTTEGEVLSEAFSIR